MINRIPIIPPNQALNHPALALATKSLNPFRVLFSNFFGTPRRIEQRPQVDRFRSMRWWDVEDVREGSRCGYCDLTRGEVGDRIVGRVGALNEKENVVFAMVLQQAVASCGPRHRRHGTVTSGLEGDARPTFGGMTYVYVIDWGSSFGVLGRVYYAVLIGRGVLEMERSSITQRERTDDVPLINRPMYNPLDQLIETQADNIAEIVFREAVEDDLGVETVDELGWEVVPCDPGCGCRRENESWTCFGRLRRSARGSRAWQRRWRIARHQILQRKTRVGWCRVDVTA
ncbi:hypothetical protein M422DRAFT_26582 [Sphaerobolus stellatus SS14]|nr:hypothetical protein M422DRAFT_26582 [Sphaerobolus stellatus SS14]